MRSPLRARNHPLKSIDSTSFGAPACARGPSYGGVRRRFLPGRLSPSQRRISPIVEATGGFVSGCSSLSSARIFGAPTTDERAGFRESARPFPGCSHAFQRHHPLNQGGAAVLGTQDGQRVGQAAAEHAEQAKQALHDIYLAPSRKDAEKAFDDFEKLCEKRFPKAVEFLRKDREELLAFYDFPAEHWVHLRTTNPIESTLATIRAAAPNEGLRQPRGIVDDGVHVGPPSPAPLATPERLGSNGSRLRSPCRRVIIVMELSSLR